MLDKLINPLEPYIATIKMVVLGILLATLIGMGLYIKYQSGEISNLTDKLQTSEHNVELLNNEITKQNESIAIANAKFNEVQTQLNEANVQNKRLTKGFDEIRGSLGNKPLPQTCDEIKTEMLLTGKELSKKWKN